MDIVANTVKDIRFGQDNIYAEGDDVYSCILTKVRKISLAFTKKYIYWVFVERRRTNDFSSDTNISQREVVWVLSIKRKVRLII